jgi:hypothetical protein
MRVAGVEVPAPALLEFALLLREAAYHDLARRIGAALDANLSELELTPADRAAALSVLLSPPEGLGQLRGALLSYLPSFRDPPGVDFREE